MMMEENEDNLLETDEGNLNRESTSIQLLERASWGSQVLEQKEQMEDEKNGATQENTPAKDEVEQYLDQIKSYANEQQKGSRLKYDYMQWQTDLNVDVRQDLIGWLVAIHSNQHYSADTLHMAVNMIDSFCNQSQSLQNVRSYLLLGMVSFYMAAKYQEVKLPKMKEFLKFAENRYSQEEFIWMESRILHTLDFNLSSFTCYWQLTCKFEELNISALGRQFSNYLLELTLLDYNFYQKQPHALSCAIIYFTHKKYKLKKTSLSSKFCTHQFQINPQIFKEYFNAIIDLYCQRNFPKFTTINQKYEAVLSQIHSYSK